MSERRAAATRRGGGVSATADSRAPLVALVGAPNVGKSTLFNRLTGSRRDVGNWPGTTVEVGRGAWEATDANGRPHELDVVDLPGAYSLDPQSPDEALARDLLQSATSGRPDLVVVVADATTLARSLYLAAQLREECRRIVVAVTMADVAARRGRSVDPRSLATAVGVPCVLVDPRHGHGVDTLSAVVVAALVGPAPHARARRPDAAATAGGDERLAAAEERFEWVAGAVDAAVRAEGDGGLTWSDRLDRAATSSVVGPMVFLAVMWLVFQLTTRAAAPMQDLLDRVVSGPLTAAVVGLLGMVGQGDSWVREFVVDGLLAGVGMLLTFVPVMAMMFALLAVLEDSGYLARAAVVTERLMRAIGLPGRAFLPLVVGFGCNVPAISATRVLPDTRHRLLTALLVPFTSCSARLTVYVLVATTFFGSQAGNVVFAMYVVSVVLVVLVGLLLRGTLMSQMGREPMVLDLPPYHRPHVRIVILGTWVRLQGFLRTAGGIIVATVAAVWVLSSIPAGSGTFAQVPVEDSVYAATAQAVAPVFEPAGFGDWHATSALMTGFVAKEAVVSSWAQTYATQEPSDARQPGALGDALRADFEASSGGHPTAAVLAFLVFLLAYTPCVATLAAQLREIGARWMAFGVTLQMAVAWLLAVAVFQVGRLL